MAPAAAVGIFNLGTNAALWLPLAGVAVAVSYFWAAVFSRLRARPLDTGWPVHALIFSLLMPVSIPLGFAALALSFGLIFGCHVFGGTGRYLVHPALLAVVFIEFAYPAQVDLTAWLDQDLVTSAWFASACLLGALILIALRLPCAAIVVGGVVGITVGGTLMGEVGPLSHLVLGHFAFALAFIATDRATQPASAVGCAIFGALFGMLTIVLRTADPDHPEGTWAALLLASLVIPLIDHLTVRTVRVVEAESTDAGGAHR